MQIEPKSANASIATFQAPAFFLVIVSFLVVIAGTTDSIVWAQADLPDRVLFDIPSQPLVSALEQYGAAAKRELLYDARLAPGQISTTVRGELPLTHALQILLQGTGLVANFATETAIVIMPSQQERIGPVNRSSPASADQDRRTLGAYYGVLQKRIIETFCAKAALQPGNYRVAVQFWVEGAGHIARIGLLGSTGDLRRDDAIVATLRGMDVGATPPAGLEQPFTLVIRPQSLHQAC